MLPPNARTTMAINVKMLPKADAAKPAVLGLTFSTHFDYELCRDCQL